MANSRSGDSIITRVVRVLEAFTQENAILSVTEISQRAELHVATTSRIVEQLVRHGLLQREVDRRLRVGVRMWELAARASPTLSLRDVAMPFMSVLHAAVRQHTQLGILDGCQVISVERLTFPDAVVNYARVAGRLPLYASSLGLVLLAHADTEYQERVLAAPLKVFTRYSIGDAKTLRAVLADVRTRGHAFTPGFMHEDACGLAAPLRGPGGRVTAALGVVVPNDTQAHQHLHALLTTADAISQALSKEARTRR